MTNSIKGKHSYTVNLTNEQITGEVMGSRGEATAAVC